MFIFLSLSIHLQECLNINSVVDGVPYLAPYILMTGSLHHPEQAFLVVDKTIISEIQGFENIPFILLSAFFVFNIKYPAGCNNFYSFLEVLLLQLPIKKASITVKHFISSLSH